MRGVGPKSREDAMNWCSLELTKHLGEGNNQGAACTPCGVEEQRQSWCCCCSGLLHPTGMGSEEVVAILSLQNTLLSAAQRTRETHIFSWGAGAHWLIPLMGRDTEVRQLRSGSCHYLEKNKAENVPGGLSKLPSPTSMVTALLAASNCRWQC